MKLIILGAALLLICCTVSGIDPLVETSVGLIRGLKATDGEYSMFMGIPYATVDEDNPFGLSKPYGRFNQTFEAYDDSAICPQIDEFTNKPTGTLDCLHLHIYVPDSATTKNRVPVMVWIHGGGFRTGFGGRYLYGPKFLVKQDVVYVSINYRLGPYGFMCHRTPEEPGNQGLKDQLMALRWIKENIGSFGGDSNKITLFGESAGGISIDYHLLSAQERLFNNIILQSGTALMPALITEDTEEGTLKLASHLGLVTDNVVNAVSYLSQINSDLVIAAASEINYRFLPCVEKDIDNTEKFISDHPINLDVPKAKNIAILIGHNDDEYLSRDAEYYKNLNVFDNKLSNAFDFDEEELVELEAIVRHFYIGDEEMTTKVKEDLVNFDSDFAFTVPAKRSITKYINNGAANVFYYMFTYNGGRNYVKTLNNVTEGGAAHCDEIGYLFDISYMTETPSYNDQLVLDRMTTMWANFAKYSDPTPNTDDLLTITWEPVQEGKLNYLNIGSDLQMQNRPFKERVAFWDLFFKHYEKNRKGYKL